MCCGQNTGIQFWCVPNTCTQSGLITRQVKFEYLALKIRYFDESVNWASIILNHTT
jgi:hypothetical protein